MTRFAVTGPTALTAEGERIVADMVLLALQGDDDATEFTSGCAYGADTIAVFAAECAEVPLIRLTLPTATWHNEVLAARAEACSWEIVRVFQGRWAAETYMRRNSVTVSFADVLLAFPDSATEEWAGSGTWATIRRARKAGCEIRFFPLDGSEPWIDDPDLGRLPGL